MAQAGEKIGRALIPLLLHMGISCGVTLIGVYVCDLYGKSRGMAGMTPDAALLTVISALVSLPALAELWKRDRAVYPSAVARRERPVRFYGAAFLCGALASCLGGFLMEQSGIAARFSNQVQEELFASELLTQFLGLGVVVPVMEELLYRGLVYQRLREGLPRRYAVGAAALIFALSHGNVIQILYALPMALFLHWFYEACGSLTAPILFHMGANLISICVEAVR